MNINGKRTKPTTLGQVAPGSLIQLANNDNGKFFLVTSEKESDESILVVDLMSGETWFTDPNLTVIAVYPDADVHLGEPQLYSEDE